MSKDAERVEPALTAAEWAKRRAFIDGARYVHEVVHAAEGDRHALAALALHGQPFGFTREDVAFLRDWHGSLMTVQNGMASGMALHIASLADRLAALLPPE